jgi:hypothetical protein
MVTEIFCEEEILIEEDHIGFDVKETEGDLSVAEGFELKGHMDLPFFSIMSKQFCAVNSSDSEGNLDYSLNLN